MLEFIRACRCRAAVIAVILGLLAGTPAPAQETGVHGRLTVVDQTGAGINGATVKLVSDSGAEISLVGTELGIYEATIPPGQYRLEVSFEGFVPVRRTVRIPASVKTITDRVVLSVGHEERLDVVALPLVARTGLNGLTLTGKELDLLPTNEIEMLYRLLELAGSRGRPGDVAIYVDGFRDFRRLPPKGAIEVIQINAEPYSAEFSEPGTRRIEIITKPGSDGVFGELKSDFNDESLNATDPLANGKPALQKITASGYFSAPIIKQRWGIVAYAGSWDQAENAIINARTLDAALQPIEHHETLPAPSQIRNYTLNSGFGLSSRLRLRSEYSRDELTGRNQGLTGGLSLAERAFGIDSVTEAGRLNFLAVLGDSTFFDLRMQRKEEDAHTRAQSTAPALIVADAFVAGGNQSALDIDKRTTTSQLDAKLTTSFGKHMFSTGLQASDRRLAVNSLADYGGTYIFGSAVERDANGVPIIDANGNPSIISPLDNYRRVRLQLPGYTPSQFKMIVGDPFASITQLELAYFIQNDWTPTANLTLSAGVRGEWQEHLHGVRVAPRGGLAWQPSPKFGVIRTGVGAFDDRFDPDLTLDTIRMDGQRQKQLLVDNPEFFPFIPPSTIDPPAILQTVMQKSPELRGARLLIGNLSYEREFGKHVMASAGITMEEGRRLTRLVDINAPQLPEWRPDPTRGQILEFQSVGRSRREELQLGLRVSLNAGSRLLANYTLSSTKSDVDNERSIPADSHNLGIEYSPTALDERHRVFLSGTIMFPRLWLLVPAFTYASARPFNITTGLDNNFDGQLMDRPAFASEDEEGVLNTKFGWLDPIPEPGDQIIPRNFGRAAPSMKFDLSLSKVIMVGNPNSNRTLTFSLNGENILNNRMLRDYNGIVLAPNFSTANTAEKGRRITFATAVNF